MLIDPWAVIKGTFWIITLMIVSMLGMLYLIVKILLWTYRGCRWAWRHRHV